MAAAKLDTPFVQGKIKGMTGGTSGPSPKKGGKKMGGKMSKGKC